ncbi:MAG TPA: PP2C family serine/threonine-protein phosphatase [Vicinamibacterales bacterium]|nr:PP2C family serine/threonine-protein phosphatase [Vicinamibacterales bacterium]
MTHTEPDKAATSVTRLPFRVKSFGLTHPGRVRTSNEDQFLIAELAKTMRVWQTSLPEAKVQRGEERGNMFLVADGMGGHQAGERASELAVLAIEQFTLNTFKWFFGSSAPDAQRVLSQFQAALRQADAQIMEQAAEDPTLRGMGTTVTMAYQLDVQLCVVHVGDSRAYIHRDDTLYQLTEDHTAVADMVRAGTVTAEDAAGHRLRHVITNCVGGAEAGLFVEARAVELHGGDRLLLCSDGLTEMVPDDVIAQVLRNTPDPEDACQRLLHEANEAGGRDNITIVVVRFDPVDATSAGAGTRA